MLLFLLSINPLKSVTNIFSLQVAGREACEMPMDDKPLSEMKGIVLYFSFLS